MKVQFFDIELDFDEKELCLKKIYIENDCTKYERMYWYDKEWHLIKVKDVYSDGIERIVEYEYNEERNLILEKVDSDGVETKIEYEYDRNGKRSEIEHSMAE